MAPLPPPTILDIWEDGRAADALHRALVVWAAVGGDPVVELAHRPIGERDAALLRSRIDTFGPDADCYVECPACATPLEMTLDLTQLDSGPPSDGGRRLEHDGWVVDLRLPTTADLREALTTEDPGRFLLAAAVAGASLQGSPASPARAAEELADAIDAALRRIDPQTDVELKLVCATCQHRWVVRFDIAAFYWRELEVEAQRLLREVHALATAYGWTEGEVFAIGANRRRRYIELVELRS